ncbi:MAG: AI-2E family transporter [Ignavibacteriales bacterium]|nr:AI-2E family transporter [Ignavibacteriales bacterium]
MKPSAPSHPFIKVTFLIGAIACAFWIGSLFPDLVLALILSALAAFILGPFVSAIESRFGMKRVPAIIITFITVGGALVFLLSLLLPLLLDRLISIHGQIQQFPFEAKLQELTKGLEGTIPFVNSASLAQSIHGAIQSAADEAGNSIQKALGTLVTLVIVPFVTYFLLADGRRAFTALIRRVPNHYFEMTLNVVLKIRRQLVGYFKGWLLDSMIIGLLTIVGLSILGIQYSIIIGVLAGIANLVPYLGPLVGASLAILVSLTQVGDFGMVGSIIILTVIIRMIDDFVVQPLCFAKSVDMHPLTVILLLLIGHEIMGIGGMLLAIPLATIIKVSAVETFWGLKNYRITA